MKKAVAKYNRQSNKITRSGDVFTVPEKRMFYVIVNRFTNLDVSKANKDMFGNYLFDFKLDDITKGDNFLVGKRARKFAEEFSKKQIKLIDKDEDTVEDGEVYYKLINIFSHVELTKKGIVNYLSCGVNPQTAQLFTELKGKFTQYDLESVLFLSSTYSQKMYENFCQWKVQKWWKPTIEELRFITQTEKKKYVTGMFLKRVIDDSVREINEKTDITVQYETVKDGNKIAWILFTIKTKENKENSHPTPINKDNREFSVILNTHFKGISKSLYGAICTNEEAGALFKETWERALEKSKDPVKYLAFIMLEELGIK